jgi:hypothetical protein
MPSPPPRPTAVAGISGRSRDSTKTQPVRRRRRRTLRRPTSFDAGRRDSTRDGGAGSPRADPPPPVPPPPRGMRPKPARGRPSGFPRRDMEIIPVRPRAIRGGDPPWAGCHFSVATIWRSVFQTWRISRSYDAPFFYPASNVDRLFKVSADRRADRRHVLSIIMRKRRRFVPIIYASFWPNIPILLGFR